VNNEIPPVLSTRHRIKKCFAKFNYTKSIRQYFSLLVLLCLVIGSYSSDHPTILLFWEVVNKFTPAQRSSLLKFVTSCSRPPLLGFKVKLFFLYIMKLFVIKSISAWLANIASFIEY